MSSLALFDFDGTITEKDSFIEFIKFYRGKKLFYIGFFILSPMLILYKAGIIRNWRTKEAVFTYFFKNEKIDLFSEKCTRFCTERIPALVKPRAMELISDHLRKGDRIIVVSATFEYILYDWCNSNHLEIVGTKMEVKNGLITGRLDGENCYGAEKARRLNLFLDFKQFTEVYAYSDSKSDLPMLELANHRYLNYL